MIGTRFDLERQSKAVCEEILAYKWIESEKSGCDIGQDRAAREWISRHYETWFRSHSEQFL